MPLEIRLRSPMSVHRLLLACCSLALVLCGSSGVAGQAKASGLAAADDREAPGASRGSGAPAPAGARRPRPAQAGEGVAAADAIVARWVEEERIPGAVLLVSRAGRVVLEKAYGHAQLLEYGDGQYGARGPSGAWEPRPGGIRRLEDPRPMSVDTAFDLASVTKVMATTFGVMLLVDDGELDLDASVRDWLPDFTGGGKERITPRHLLTHRSGLAQWWPVYYEAGDADRAWEVVRDLPLSWGVGEERHYSDLGFMVLGRLVERAAGTSLGDFLEERLYGPLGLTATGFRPLRTPLQTGPEGRAGQERRAIHEERTSQEGGPIQEERTGREGPEGRGSSTEGPAHRFAATSHGNPFEYRMVHDPDFGYLYDGDPGAWDGWRRYTLAGEVNDGNAFHAFGGEAGHAGLFSTAGDLHVLLRLLLDRGESDGRRYLGADVVGAFLEPHGDDQALGWQLLSGGPPDSFVHPGFTGTWVLFRPAEDLAVVLLTNRQNVGVDDRTLYPDMADLQRDVADALVAR